MIIGEIPPSSGSIQVDGDRVAVCLQSNEHLAAELTVAEHLIICAVVYGFHRDEAQVLCERMMSELMLDEHKNKIARELSGGNARQFAVGLALLLPVPFVLLDEPTSSLDPIVRHNVHGLIARLRGERTILLYTHLLGEAESLCDTIAIMMKGEIMVVGTPQYLSSRFGTEWRVDLLLADADEETAERVTQFVAEKLPRARLLVKRSRNRIYAVPAEDIEIAPLFRQLKDAVQSQIGIHYFTCSSTTLEKVFLELVMPAEEE
jgi:ABC-type multidrug transport system ATPase subunit